MSGYEHEMIEAAIAVGSILCHCGIQAVTRVCKSNDKGNAGKEFFACPKGKDQGCNFFRWRDEENNGGTSGSCWRNRKRKANNNWKQQRSDQVPQNNKPQQVQQTSPKAEHDADKYKQMILDMLKTRIEALEKRVKTIEESSKETKENKETKEHSHPLKRQKTEKIEKVAPPSTPPRPSNYDSDETTDPDFE
jgi:hypothetical protein